MTSTSKSLLGAGLLSLALLALLPPGWAGAQETRDFLFGKPRVVLSLHGGYGVASAGSDLFQDVDTIFTLGKSDFNAPVISGSLAIFLNDRMDLTAEIGYLSAESWSEYRDWVEELEGGVEVPIEQKTTFLRVPMTLSLRYFLMDRGREISRFAWVPTRWAPYLGAGLGRIYYRFEQEGDFVDFVDYSIAGDKISSAGYAWTGHVFAGAQYAVSPHFVFTGETRYSWANADLDRSFYQGYEPIDLSGFQATLGFGVRF